MANIQTINTEAWYIRINYHDGDVLDQRVMTEGVARERAKNGSRTLKADIDVCHGAAVIATYRDGLEVAAE